MKLNLIYQFYVKTNLSAKDYFHDITSSIEPEYPHTLSKVTTLFMPVEYSDIDKATQNGVMMIEKVIHGASHLHYVIQELRVSFDIPEEDYCDILVVRDHILEKFGKKATMYQLLEEDRLRDPE